MNSGLRRARSDVAQALRQAQMAWLDAVRTRTGLSLTQIARSADLHPSSVTQFYNNERRGGMLSALTIRRISDATGVPATPAILGETGSAAAGGFREPEAATFDFAGATPELAAMVAAATAAPHVVPWELRSRALEFAGFMPGDILLVDLNARPQRGDVVCAQFYDPRGSGAEIVFRLYEPPFLVAHGPDEAHRRPRLVDDATVAIMGVVTMTLRRRRQLAG